MCKPCAKPIGIDIFVPMMRHYFHMAQIALNGSPVHTFSELPATGSKAPDFELVGADLGAVKLSDFAGSKLVLNVFPSIDTGVCAMSVRQFNERAAGLADTKVLCISNDLPFALARFCGAEGIDDVVVGSAFRSDFGHLFGVTMVSGALAGLLARSVFVLDADGIIRYQQLVPEITTEPDYDAAVAALG